MQVRLYMVVGTVLRYYYGMVLWNGNGHMYVYRISRSWMPLLRAIDIYLYCLRKERLREVRICIDGTGGPL